MRCYRFQTDIKQTYTSFKNKTQPYQKSMQNSIQFAEIGIEANRLNPQPKKIDILFYDSINHLKNSLNCSAFYHLFKTLIFSIFIPIDYTIINNPKDARIMAAMILALVASFFQFIVLILFRTIAMANNKFFVTIASEMGHSTDQPITGSFQKLQNCVSKTMYNQQNQTLISNQGLTKDLKEMYTKFLSFNIKQITNKNHPCLNFLDHLSEFIGLAAIVYGIVALSIGQKNTPQLVLLIVFICLQGFSKIFILIVFLIIALIPVLCLIVCCLCCFYRPQDTEVKLPSQEKATEKMITEADGTCTICFQNFIVGDNIIRLKCSPKHMFHPLCISGWTKLKATCPICRASIGNERGDDSNPQNQI